MKKVKVIYTIHNHGDGSAGVQFHACEKSAEIALELESEPFCENGPYIEEMTATGRPAKIDLIYTIHNNGDGSAGVQFHKTMAAAKRAVKAEEDGGEAFCENEPSTRKLVFDERGTLTTPSFTLHELMTELAEMRGEEPPPPPPPAPTADLTGLRLVFTGTMDSMHRRDAEELAKSLGASVCGVVTNKPGFKTDFLIAGRKVGSKVRVAQQLKVTILTEEEWNKKIGYTPK